jgi:hypothetical protein
VELVSRSLAAVVNAELDAIQRVYERHGQRDSEGRVFGFREIHLRSIVSLAEPPGEGAPVELIRRRDVA